MNYSIAKAISLNLRTNATNSTCKTLQNVTVLIHSFIDINLVLNSKHCEINETNY